MTRTDNTASSEPLLDLQRLVVTVRRKRRMWLSAGLIGVLAGLMLAVFLPSPPTAVTQLMIVHEEDQASDSGNLMETDTALLHTTRIASLALQQIGSTESASDFLKTYEGIGLTSNMMEIHVEGRPRRTRSGARRRWRTRSSPTTSSACRRPRTRTPRR